ncbi:MAG: hypothetical protein A2231_02545 [Candidatus Firestonebacteria bacterium RIFOXYA2_FULL_40_8]|nr:MAG: hypothetical protein A2231_02545 [Candidatus Firestonebacteria bacterium RIFOXYA2_FULL_40_8]
MSASFEDIPGARPIGMSGAFTSIADDVNALFYNPAGLSKLGRIEVTGLYEQQYAGLGENICYSYFGSVLPLGDLGRFGISGSMSYTSLYQEYMVALSYGLKVSKSPSVSLGVNIKWLSKTFTQNEYTAIDPLFLNSGLNMNFWSYDIGGLIDITKQSRIGVMLMNINQPVDSYDGDRLPLKIKAGGMYNFDILTASVEGEYGLASINGHKDLNLSAGIEKWICENNLGLRAGISFLRYSIRSISVGATYKIDGLQIDYALQYPISGITGTLGNHIVQLTYKFGSPISDEPLIKVDVKLPDGMKKMAIAVLDLEGKNISSETTLYASELLRSKLFKARLYDVVERNNMDKILKEQSFQLTGCTSSECAVEVGKILNAYYVVMGNIIKLENSISIQVRFVDVEKGNIVMAEETTCKNEDGLGEAISVMVNKISEQINITGKDVVK